MLRMLGQRRGMCRHYISTPTPPQAPPVYAMPPPPQLAGLQGQQQQGASVPPGSQTATPSNTPYGA